MPSLAYIPKAILASVIITSVIFMVELEELKPMWKSRSTSVSNPKYRQFNDGYFLLPHNERDRTIALRCHILVLSLCQHGIRNSDWSWNSLAFVSLHRKSTSSWTYKTAGKFDIIIFILAGV
jgi:hypothetical protein